MPPAPTVQAAVVVLPVRAHGVLFAYKHHFGHAHLRETSSLQGPAHAEQLLQPNGQQTHTQDESPQHRSAESITKTKGAGLVGSARCTYDYVLFGDSGVQVVHRYFRPLQRTDNRLGRHKALRYYTYRFKPAEIWRNSKHTGCLRHVTAPVSLASARAANSIQLL